MWAEFMDELREAHLGVKLRGKKRVPVSARLRAAYEKVVTRQKPSPPPAGGRERVA
jgi:hypothetical protein